MSKNSSHLKSFSKLQSLHPITFHINLISVWINENFLQARLVHQSNCVASEGTRQIICDENSLLAEFNVWLNQISPRKTSILLMQLPHSFNLARNCNGLPTNSRFSWIINKHVFGTKSWCSLTRIQGRDDVLIFQVHDEDKPATDTTKKSKILSIF